MSVAFLWVYTRSKITLLILQGKIMPMLTEQQFLKKGFVYIDYIKTLTSMTQCKY